MKKNIVAMTKEKEITMKKKKVPQKVGALNIVSDELGSNMKREIIDLMNE